MNTRESFTVLFLVIVLIGFACPAWAGINSDYLKDQIIHNTSDSNAAAVNEFFGTLSGSYEAIYLGFHSATSSNTFWSPTDGRIFRNHMDDPNNPGGVDIIDTLPGATWSGTNLQTNQFRDVNNPPEFLNINTDRGALTNDGYERIRLFELLMDWTVYEAAGNILVPKGWIVLGFEENANGDDFNDLVVAVNMTGAPVPIPGAVWLLGTGLLGLLGLRRVRK